jgi:hypothetical protein
MPPRRTQMMGAERNSPGSLLAFSSLPTDNKPLVSGVSHDSPLWSARQQQQLAIMAVFTEDFCHMPGEADVVSRALSKPVSLQLALPLLLAAACCLLPPSNHFQITSFIPLLLGYLHLQGSVHLLLGTVLLLLGSVLLLVGTVLQLLPSVQPLLFQFLSRQGLLGSP